MQCFKWNCSQKHKFVIPCNTTYLNLTFLAVSIQPYSPYPFFHKAHMFLYPHTIYTIPLNLSP